MTAVIILLIFGSIVMTLWGGAAAVAAGSITGGTVLSFIIGSMLVAGAFGALTEVLENYSEEQVLPAAQRIT